MKHICCFFLWLYATSTYSCTMKEWIGDTSAKHIQKIHYDLPLPDSNTLFFKPKLFDFNETKGQWFLYHTSLKKIWFSQKNNCKIPTIIDYTQQPTLVKKIENITSSFLDNIDNRFDGKIKASVAAIFLVPDMEKIGSFQTQYRIILIKAKKIDFITHKTLLHEIAHSLDIHHPHWLSEGLSEWLAIDFLEEKYPKRVNNFKKKIISLQKNSAFQKTNLYKWHGKWKYEKSYFIIQKIYQWLGERVFKTFLQKKGDISIFKKHLSESQYKQLKAWTHSDI